MKDIAHHRKHLQRKIVHGVKENSEPVRVLKEPVVIKGDHRDDRHYPEYEGKRFDPHHRKPRLLKRINYH